jgi:hypothetical protein
MLQGSHMGPAPVMPWGGSPTAGQPSTWLPHRLQLDTGRHRLQPPIQARVLALFPHLQARDIGHHRRHL